MYNIGVYRKGKLLFTLCPNVRTYREAAFACILFEAMNLPLQDNDYIACEEK